MTLLPGFYKADVEADLRLTWSLFEVEKRKRKNAIAVCCMLRLLSGDRVGKRPRCKTTDAV